LKDFCSYVVAQEKIDELYSNRQKWLQMGITNVAHAGVFSSDRTINEYSVGIWNLKPV
jgi:starch phosphorylase